VIWLLGVTWRALSWKARHEAAVLADSVADAMAEGIGRSESASGSRLRMKKLRICPVMGATRAWRPGPVDELQCALRAKLRCVGVGVSERARRIRRRR